jgi:hypothetical protein
MPEQGCCVRRKERAKIQPSFDYPQNLTLPDSAWNAETEAGSWTWQVNYPAGVSLVAMMSDATADGVCLSCFVWLARPYWDLLCLEGCFRVTAAVVGSRGRQAVRVDPG